MRATAVCVSAGVLCWAIGGSGLAQGKPPPSSLTLQGAYQLALARSEAAGIAKQRVEQAEVARLFTWVPMAPQASISGAAVLQNESQLQGLGALRASASLAQPLFRRGFFATREAGQLEIEAATLSFQRARQQVMLEVTTAFVAVLRGRQALLVAEAAVQRANAQEAAATARVQAGGALRTAQLQATISFRQAEVEKVRIARLLKLEEVAFERLVGVAPPASISLPATPALPAAEQAAALARERVDLRALQQQALSARALERSLGGLRWPRLDLRAGYNTAFGFIPSSTGGGWGVLDGAFGLVELSIPLFQGGEEFFRAEAQRVEAELATLRANQLDKQITEELGNALTELDSARSSFALAERLIKDAQENYTLVTNQFKLRTVTFIEVAAAQSTLTNAENLLLISNFDRELAAYRLLFAIGTLQL